MATVERGEGQITPENLQTSLDVFLDAKGSVDPAGVVWVEFFPMDQRLPNSNLEICSYDALSRRHAADGGVTYLYERVSPRFRSSQRKLTFAEGTVSCRRRTIGHGVSKESDPGPSELSPREVEQLYTQSVLAVNDPRWENRQETIASYRKAQRANRNWVGQAIADWRELTRILINTLKS